MADVQSLLKNILSAVYGKDVRQSIHDAIRQCYIDGKAGGNDLEARERAAAAEARMDTFTKLQAGSTTGDGELIDIRLGFDGTEYENAGTAVREQIRNTHVIEVTNEKPTRENTQVWINPDETDEFCMPEIKDSEINNEDTWSSEKIVGELQSRGYKKNLIDFNTVSTGFGNITGGVDPLYNRTRWEIISDYIPVEPGLPYTLSTLHNQDVDGWVGINAYDTNKTFVSVYSDSVDSDPRFLVTTYTGSTYTGTFTFPDSVAYVRVSFRSYKTGKIKFEQSLYPSGFDAEQTHDDILIDKPLIFEGYIQSDGSIAVTTETYEEKFSGFITVNPGEDYSLYNFVDKLPWFGISYYDETGEFIERITSTTLTPSKYDFVIPEGVSLMNISARTKYLTGISLFKTCKKLSTAQQVCENRVNSEHNAMISINHNVKAVAHRGFSSEAPENTLPAFKLARQKGFEHAECDVSFTSDGVGVLLHDLTIDRTSTGSGSVSEMTYEEVSTYDYGSWFSEEYVGTKIPTFEEFIQLCRNIGLKPYIEVKSGTVAQIKALVGVVKSYGLLESATWISFSSTYLTYVKSAYSKARLGLVVDSVTSSNILEAQKLQNGENEVFIDSGSCTYDEATLCMNVNLPMEAWTINTPGGIRALSTYVSGVTSDALYAPKILLEQGMNS